MAADLKPQSGGVGVRSGTVGVGSGEAPTAEMGVDQTLPLMPPPVAPNDSEPGTEVTVSFPGILLSAIPETDDIARTTSLLPGASGANGAVAAVKPLHSRSIGPYTILRELGRGGMGVVYLARHEQLGRTVALKMILAGNQAGEEAQQRFLVEAQSIARMSHPGIVSVYDIGKHDGMPYFSLEYVPGNSLSRMIVDKPLEPKAAAMLVAKMATAMQYAHDKGVLHRDLKPANVLMADDETPKITDFGLAKQIEGAQEAELTQTGTIMGTPSYMSPEQAGGDPQTLGPPTDQYSLGAILYQLLVGRAPFVAPRTFDVIRQVLTVEPVALRKLAPQVPADLETICLKAMHKEAARRYANCRELADELTRFLEGRPILARPVSRQERFVRWCRRNPVVAATSVTAIAAWLAVFAVVCWSSYSLALKNSELEVRRKIANERAKLANDSYKLLIDKTRNALSPYPQLSGLSKELILAALAGLEKLPDDPADIENNGGLQKAKAEEFFYQSYLQVGEHSQAIPHIETALAILQKRNEAQQGTDATRLNLASCLLAKSRARKSFERDMELSLKCSGESVALLESILAEPKPKAFNLDLGSMEPLTVRQELLRSRNMHTAALWQQGRISAALSDARRNVAILDETFKVLPQLKDLPVEQKRAARSGMAWIHQLRAVTALRAGETKEAAEQQKEALELAQLSVQVSNGSFDARKNLAEVLGFAGDLHVSQKEDDKARQAYEEAVKLARENYAQDPITEPSRNATNILLIRLAGFEKSRNPETAKKLYQEALQIARQMVQADPLGQTHQVALALSLAPTGAHQEASGIANKLLAATKNPDAELLVDMARVYSQCSAAAGLKEAEAAAYQKKALDCLTQAESQGYRDHVYLTSHPDFVPLKTAQPYLDLVQKIIAQKTL